MTEQYTLFPVEVLPDRPTVKPPERVKDPGCYIVRARWRTFHFTTQEREFTTLEAARRHVETMHPGWNNRRIYHIAEPETCKWTDCGTGWFRSGCRGRDWLIENLKHYKFCPECGRRFEI